MKLVRSIVLMSLGGLLPTATVGQTIVWTDQSARRIQRKDVNGGAVGTIVQFSSLPAATQIHYDAVTAKLYYRLSGTAFQRANLDGSNRENIPTPSLGIFTLNVESRKLYWINPGDTLNRSELNGAGVESHSYPSCCLFTLEAIGGEVFFGGGLTMGKGIWRADADGSNEQYVHQSGAPMDLAHDPVENKLYLATIDAIVRLNPDGTGFEEIVYLPAWQQLNSGPEQVVVDFRARKVYWADPTAKVIQRSNLDGSNVEDFVTASDVENPNFDIRGLTIVYTSRPIPTLSGWGLMAMTALLLGAGLLVLKKRTGDALPVDLPRPTEYAVIFTRQIASHARPYSRRAARTVWDRGLVTGARPHGGFADDRSIADMRQ